MLKVIRFIDRATDIILILLFLLLFLIGGYAMYDTALIYGQADIDLLSYKPTREDVEKGWDMSALSDDVVAWLTVYDTNIDYPVMQGKNNMEYLNKDPYGEYSLAGSIFLDARNAPDFSDPYNLIYGHHMEYGRMFGGLDEYFDEEYFDAHRKGELLLSDKVYDIEFFACLKADASVKEIFAPTETDGTLEYVRQHAVIWREPDGEKLIALSTCKKSQTTGRTIVFGVMKE